MAHYTIGTNLQSLPIATTLSPYFISNDFVMAEFVNLCFPAVKLWIFLCTANIVNTNYKACPSESGTDKFMQRFI